MMDKNSWIKQKNNIYISTYRSHKQNKFKIYRTNKNKQIFNNKKICVMINSKLLMKNTGMIEY